MRKMQRISRAVLLSALVVLAVHFFVMPLPDWAVRVDGALLVVAIFTTTFSTVRLQKMK
jgi:membrane protein YdbS with pleckstrin-like domain